MPLVYGDYVFIFDDVQFAIDVRAFRHKRGETMAQFAAHFEKSGGWINGIENGRYDKHLLLKDFVAICALADLHPHDYFDLQRRDA